MHVQSYPFSPVRPPVVRSAPKPALSAVAMGAAQKMTERESELRRKNALRALGGMAIVVVVLAGGIVLAKWAAAADVNIHNAQNPEAMAKTPDAWNCAMILSGLLIATTLPVAAFTKKHSRADAIDRYINEGGRACARNGDPVLGLIILCVMLCLLYGEFLIVDSVKTTWLRFRLRTVDRQRAAFILAMLFSSPTGVDPRTLLRLRENPIDLRRTIAYLMAYEWADISSHGDYLNLLSPANRALRC